MHKYSIGMGLFALTLAGIAGHSPAGATTLINNGVLTTSLGAPGISDTSAPGHGGICTGTGCTNSTGIATTTVTNAVGETVNVLPLQAALSLYDSDYTMTISVQDASASKDSYYQVALDGVVLMTTPNTAGASASTKSASITLGDGMAPVVHDLEITDEYFAINGTTLPGNVSSSPLLLTVTYSYVPEPASIALFGAGLGLLGAARRRFRR